MSSIAYVTKIANDTKDTNNFVSTNASSSSHSTPTKASYSDVTNQYRTAGAGRVDINQFNQKPFAELYNIHYAGMIPTASSGSFGHQSGQRRQRDTPTASFNTGAASASTTGVPTTGAPLAPPLTQGQPTIPKNSAAAPPPVSGGRPKYARTEEKVYCQHHQHHMHHTSENCTLNPQHPAYTTAEAAAVALAKFRSRGAVPRH
jgi:hypothetical protein